MTLRLADTPPGARPEDPDDRLLAVRFALPRRPTYFVERPRLTALLDRAAAVPLTLVSAPAGSGKTSLVASWAAERTAIGETLWLSFEKEDVAPDRFWGDVLERVRGHVVEPVRWTEPRYGGRSDLV